MEGKPYTDAMQEYVKYVSMQECVFGLERKIIQHRSLTPLYGSLFQCFLSAPGGLVLDPFAGSGVVHRMAIAEERNSICIELDPSMLSNYDSEQTSFDLKTGVSG